MDNIVGWSFDQVKLETIKWLFVVSLQGGSIKEKDLEQRLVGSESE
jgi:hypothetical protein